MQLLFNTQKTVMTSLREPDLLKCKKQILSNLLVFTTIFLFFTFLRILVELLTNTHKMLTSSLYSLYELASRAHAFGAALEI